MATLRIKRRTLSNGTGTPGSLAQGEMGYSEHDQKVFIGIEGGGQHIIGGAGTFARWQGTGFLVQTAAASGATPPTAAARSIAGTANQITVSNGDGVSGNPTLAIADNAILPGAGGIQLPEGTTAQRPGTPGSANYLRYNTDDNIPEWWNGSGWVQPSVGGSQNVFSTVAADSGSNAVADNTTDTLTLVGGIEIATVGDSAADSITFNLEDHYEPVKVATTANHGLSGTANIDGTAISAGDRVLVWRQTSTEENGIYVAAAGAWSRATDLDSAGEFDTNKLIRARMGTKYGRVKFRIASPPLTLGTDSVQIHPLTLYLGDGTNEGYVSNEGVLFTAPAAGLTITRTSGTMPLEFSGLTFALANDLAALEGLSGTGLGVRTGTSAWANRSLTQPAAGITISNNDGVSGNPTFALANDLSALEGLASTGIAVRTAADTWAQRSIAASATNNALGISISNGDGVSGNPTVGLDIVGRTNLGAAPATGDSLLLYDLSATTNVKLAISDLFTSPALTGTPTAPTAAQGTNTTQIATTAFVVTEVAAAVTGWDYKASVRVATTAAGTLASSFENGDTIDGVTLATGDRILIKNQAAPAENGIYTVNASGAPTRATDMDAWAEVPGAFVAVELGTQNADTLWLCTADQGGTLGTTGITFNQVPAAGQITAGAALLLTGNTLDVQVDNSTIEVNADALRVKDAGITYAKVQNGTGLSVVGRAANSAGVNADIAAGADFNILRRSGTSIGFGAIDLSQAGAVGTSILDETNGGTGLSSYTAGDILYASGANTLAKRAIGSTGDVLIVSGGVPTWTNEIDGGTF